ncbi:DUF6988 family protein [Nitrospira sp. BLG_1]|uniref:DUF6988 family protein n=1 Tax=Nitrospira sp. BLG_1 TaxID=3395883 RepID=UPI0039BC360A
MSIPAELKRQVELVKWINKTLSCPYKLSSRNQQLALPCFDLAVEHHAGIYLLGESRLYGSMYALLRVEFEALARGIWLHHVASTENIAKYENEDLKIGFGAMLKLIEEQLDISTSILSLIKNKQWDIFNSFTHTGYQALVRRVTMTHTGPINYSENEVISILRHAGLFAVLAATELANMTGDQKLIESTMDQARRYGE